MKDNFLTMLMNFFEKSLAQIKESQSASNEEGDNAIDELHESDQTLVIRTAAPSAIRVFTPEEQLKLTKASYQFLMRLSQLGAIPSEKIELIIHQLLNSDSRFVTLQETKWTIRNALEDSLTAAQLAFLDLVLYQKEDQLPLH